MKKIMLLALAAVSAVLFVVPASASAGVWDIEPANGLYPLTFNIHGGTAELKTTGGTSVHCTSVSGTGSYADKTTGTINLTFHGCKAFGFNCNSTGAPAGTIVTTALPFHNVHLEPNKTKPGILITPNGTHFASFTCFIVGVTVSGNGVLGEVTSPACGATSNTAVVKFASTAPGVQLWKQVTTAGTVYNLKKGEENASQDATGTITFPQNAKLNCT
jgi:hypothetical protein